MKSLLLLVMLLVSDYSFAGLAARVKTQGATSPSVSLTCTAGSGAPTTGFNFYRGTTSGGPYSLLNNTPIATCAYTDTSVSFSTTYYYVATGVNSSGESTPSNQVTAVIPSNPVPNPPTGLTVTSIVAGNVNLEWQSPAPQNGFTVTNVVLYRGLQPTLPSPSKVATLPATATVYTDAGCKKTCYYEVKAIDKQGKKKITSAASNIAKAVVH